MNKDLTVYERYKSEIYRIGWRVQYKVKRRHSHEYSLLDSDAISFNFTASSEDTIWVKQLLDTLPGQGKLIIYKLYIQNQTESEIARELNISQQAVNKWKRKMIQKLSQTARS